MNLETNEPALSTFSSRVLSSRALLQSSTRVGNAGSCSRFRWWWWSPWVVDPVEPLHHIATVLGEW